MARVFTGERVAARPRRRAVERGALPAARRAARARVATGAATPARSSRSTSPGFVVLYAILRTQCIHPWNPQGLTAPPWDLSFNTATSFVTNTNWQFYGGETTLSYFSQMAGLAVQNFLSAAVGIAVCVAVIRGFSRREHRRLGNPWVDLTRSLLYVLLPLSLVARAVSRRAGRRPDAVGARTTVAHARRRRRRRSSPVRSPRRRRSRSSGPTAAASSTSTPRCRSRTRPGCRTSSSCSRSC